MPRGAGAAGRGAAPRLSVEMAPIVEKQTRKARRQRQNSLNGTGLEEDELAELVFASKQHDAFEDVRHLPHKTSLVALICSVPLGASTCPPQTSHPPALSLPGGLRLTGFIPGQRSGDIRHARPDVRIPNPSTHMKFAEPSTENAPARHLQEPGEPRQAQAGGPPVRVPSAPHAPGRPQGRDQAHVDQGDGGAEVSVPGLPPLQ